MARECWWPEKLVVLLDNYYKTGNEKDLKKLMHWLELPWTIFEILYGVYSELKEFDAQWVKAGLIEKNKELRLKIVELMLRGAVHNRYDRYKLASLYDIAVKEGKEEETLKIIDRFAAIGDSGYDAKTWKFFWASYPDSLLAKLAERKLAELGKPLPQMTKQEKDLLVIQTIIGSFAA